VHVSRKWLGVAVAVLGCAASVALGPRFYTPARGPRTTPPGQAPASVEKNGPRYDREIGASFEATRAQHADIGYPELVRSLALARAPEVRPAFDPTGVEYYKRIRKSLELTSAEQEIYRRRGMVGVDHGQRFSMASAYLAIYRRDLPVLVTADSILHAMHRSFDNIVIELEITHFAPAIKKLLDEAHAALKGEAGALADPALRQSGEDVDLYLTVARNLLAGPHTSVHDQLQSRRRDIDCSDAAGQAECGEDPSAVALTGRLQVNSILNQDAKVSEILAAIAALDAKPPIGLYGRPPNPEIDWSQFKPRGHYTKSADLRRYFRTMMWLGRVDVGFNLAQPHSAFGRPDVERELRDAALLSWLLRRASQLEPLAALDRAIGFLVGLSDNVTPSQVVGAVERIGVRRVADLGAARLPGELSADLAKSDLIKQRIRSQFGSRLPGGGPETALPVVFQLFGQRFVIDSFVLSKVVFDSIVFKGRAQERMMPSGLDVMAALGNDEAVGLLEPDLRKYHYGANLLAARRAMEERPSARWNSTLYDVWLSALSKLDDVPANPDFPEVMRSQAWQRKQLQTQLGSWAELRHDTILYAKQSYTMGIVCEYPTGYVEPYPEFFARIALFAEEAKRRLDELRLSNARIGTFLEGFATTARRLERLARKELAAEPFDPEEREFIKTTITIRTEPGGCGPPIVIYNGWYPKLIYDGRPELWEPTIADVHTNGKSVLEVAVGDVNLLVVAIDNRGDRTAYVGPVYSYYEFVSGQRLTDEEWRQRIQKGQLPPRPGWARGFQAPAVQRKLEPPK
jgi:hypothetical protein